MGHIDPVRRKHYEGHVTQATLVMSTVAAFGGMLLGYQNGVGGGVISHPDFQARFFPDLLHVPVGDNLYCRYDDQLVQLFTSALPIAGAFAAVLGGYTCNRYGRRRTMLAGALCFLIGTVLVSSAYHVAQLVIGRLIIGAGTGFATMATPLYLSELAPFQLRGALNILFQLANTIGVIAAQLINYGASYQSSGWRISLAVAAVIGLIFFLGVFGLPDSPNSLVNRGFPDKAAAVLQRLRGSEADVSAELADITEAVQTLRNIRYPYRTILRRIYRPQLVMAMVIPFCQQFTGINAVMFYTPQLFFAAGRGLANPAISTIIIGAVNVGATLIALFLADRVGRRLLFIQGGLQMLICEIIVGVLVKYDYELDTTRQEANQRYVNAIIAFICFYTAAFAWSWGPLAWLVPSEIQPMETRAAGMGITTFVSFMFTFVIAQTFLTMLCSMKWGVFLFFAGFCLLMTIFVIVCVPETNGIPVEQMQAHIAKHPLWRNVVAGAPSGEDYTLGSKSQSPSKPGAPGMEGFAEEPEARAFSASQAGGRGRSGLGPTPAADVQMRVSSTGPRPPRDNV